MPCEQVANRIVVIDAQTLLHHGNSMTRRCDNRAEKATTPMNPAASPGALAVQNVLGPNFRVMEFDASTRTAADAAAAIGCTVAQIAKSIVFRSVTTDRPVLVVASGSNRVDEKRIAALIGEKIARADAEFVRERTGFAIGGVPPVGHATPPIVLLDADLQSHASIWAAAGTPNAVFELTPAGLARLTGAAFADIARR